MAAEKHISLARFWHLARLRQSQGQLPAYRQAAEALVLYLFYGIGPGYYQMAAFWDRAVTWRSKTQHLSVAAYRKILAELNPMAYRKLSQNKLAEKAMLGLLRIPSPEYLGYYHRVAGRTSDGTPLNGPDSLNDYLARRPDLDKICFKSVEGWGGHGFEIAEVSRQSGEVALIRALTGKKMSLSEFCDEVLGQDAHASGSVMERFLPQHDVLAELNPSSLNTLRVWVLQDETFTTKVLLSLLRIGRSGALVDNLSSGGIVAPVDLQNGVLGPAVDYTPHHQIFSTHPDHGARIAGVRMPFFEEALDLARRTLSGFPNIRFAGVDVAIAKDGPRIIELNVSPDLTAGPALVGVPSKPLLEPMKSSA